MWAGSAGGNLPHHSTAWAGLGLGCCLIAQSTGPHGHSESVSRQSLARGACALTGILPEAQWNGVGEKRSPKSSAGNGKGEGDEDESCQEAASGGQGVRLCFGKARVATAAQGGRQREGYYFVLVLSRRTPA